MVRAVEPHLAKTLALPQGEVPPAAPVVILAMSWLMHSMLASCRVLLRGPSWLHGVRLMVQEIFWPLFLQYLPPFWEQLEAFWPQVPCGNVRP